MCSPNPESRIPPSIPPTQVPSPMGPIELNLPDELAWQRYRAVATPQKHVVRLTPMNVSKKAGQLLSGGNFLTAGILYMVAGLLYSGSPFRSTGERQYLTTTEDHHKAVEELVKSLDAFKTAEAESYCRLVQECLGIPLMKFTIEEMNDSVFTWLQNIVHPLSIPVYDACLIFKRGSHLLNKCENLNEASSFFRAFLKLTKTTPDSSLIITEYQRRLDVDRSQETIRHTNIATDFIFDYSRAVKQFLRPKFFAWWLYLASQSLVRYGLKKKYKRISRELNQYLDNVHRLVELLDKSISKLLKIQTQIETLGVIKPLYGKLLFQFHLEAATVLVDAAKILKLCRKHKEAQEKIIESLNFLQRGVECAQELDKPEWNACFRMAQAILLLRQKKTNEAKEALRTKMKALRAHSGIKAVKNLLLEYKEGKEPNKLTKRHFNQAIAKNLVIQPLDWKKFDWNMFLSE
ncbi:MAG: hypothetical protein ACE5R6_02690 [Candidatus Heimdallarchaeota archaeon]